MSATRNAAADESTSDLIVYLDADDVLPPDYVTTCLEGLRVGAGDFTFADLQCFGDSDDLRSYRPFDARSMRQRNVIPFACVFPTEMVRRVRFAEDLRTGLEDWDFFLRALVAGWTPIGVHGTTYGYRIHGTSTSRRLQHDVDRHRRLRRRIALRNWRAMGPAWTLRWLAMPLRWSRDARPTQSDQPTT